MVNLFYKSNQERMRVYNEQRTLDLINQLKQKEKLDAYNNEELYNETLADQYAKLYAKLYDKLKIPEKKTMVDRLTQVNPLQLLVEGKKQLTLEAEKIPALESGTQTEQPKKIEPEIVLLTKEEIKELEIPELKEYLDSFNEEYKSGKGYNTEYYRKLAYKHMKPIIFAESKTGADINKSKFLKRKYKR